MGREAHEAERASRSGSAPQGGKHAFNDDEVNK